ncbi:MAG: hypothetical protein KQJ78_03135 [Deltaproteobacteria bacterium]|nr:hypothetical protein [Deltaproteobacteria bacterium]
MPMEDDLSGITSLLRELDQTTRHLDHELARAARQEAFLEERLAQLEARRAEAPEPTVQTGQVQDSSPAGHPVTLDNQGRAPVVVPWDGGQETLAARLATPWNISGGGVVMLPRQGQSVWLAFERGRPESPVIIGYFPNEVTPLDYDPAATAQEGVLAAPLDENGQAVNPATANRYKTTIRSAAPDGGKVHEIAFGDQPGQEDLSLATEGRMRVYAQGEHQLSVGGKNVEHVDGDVQRHVSGKFTQQLQQDYQRHVGGDLATTVAGDKDETVTGNYTLNVEGEYTLSADTGRSVHTLAMSDFFDYYMGGKNYLTLGEEVACGARLWVRIFFPLEEELGGWFAQFHALKTEYTMMSGSNTVDETKNRITAIQEAVASMDVNAGRMGNSAARMKDTGAALNSFATKLCAGFKINV